MKKSSRNWKSRDPHAARERHRYENPLPSREYLLELVDEAARPIGFDELADTLGITDASRRDALDKRLEAMQRDGQLIRNRRGGFVPVSAKDLVTGRVIGHRDGFGFLVPDDGSSDVFIGPRQMRSLMHGDRAVLRVRGVDARGRREGSLVDVLERNTRQVVGRYLHESGVGFVVPDNARLPQDVVVGPGDAGGARPGQIVVAELIEQPSKNTPPIGRIVEVLGDHMAPGMEIDIAVRAHNLPHEFPGEVMDEAGALGDTIPGSAVRGRTDLREVPLVTIDGADAKDFDDAVHAEPAGDGWRVVVAIADVSHYVHPGSPLDREARERGTSVYFPGSVLPMLPEVLSNGLCSLMPGVDRLCMVCDMRVDASGKVTRSRFAQAVMRSAARLVYEDANRIVFERDAGARRAHEPLLASLDALGDAYRALKKARKRRGAIDFDTTETRIVFGADRKIERIEPVTRNDAHRMIEECMIAANVEAAKFIKRHKLVSLYRVHDLPDPEKLENLRAFLSSAGLRLGGGDKPEAEHYARLLERAQGRPDAPLIQTLVLRSMPQAVYSPKNIGHFGLALEHYAHFTSPIRRYPDLLLHRAIRHKLEQRGEDEFPYTAHEMERLGEHCSMTERRADDATRDAEAWLKCEYMLDHIGDEFDGSITGVTSFGMFVVLDGMQVEGLVHVSTLEDDFYQFDPVRHRLAGERAGRVFQLGDRLRVRVMRVSLDDRKIDFELVGGKKDGGKKDGRKKGDRKKGGRKKGRR